MKKVKMTKAKIKQVKNSACGKKGCRIKFLPTFKKAA